MARGYGAFRFDGTYASAYNGAMFGNPERRRQIEGYPQVGPSLSADEPEITYDAAEALRQKVVEEVFDVLSPRIAYWQNDEDKVFAARSFRPLVDNDLNDVMQFAGAMVHHQDDIWRMKIMLTRSSRLPYRLADEEIPGEKKIQTRYFLGAVAGRLILATKQVKAVRDVTEAEPDLIASGRGLRRIRRSYERHMTPDDTELLHDSLGRIIKRARV